MLVTPETCLEIGSTMFVDFFAGLAVGTGIGVLVDPRLRAWAAHARWDRRPGPRSLTDEVLERLEKGSSSDATAAVGEGGRDTAR